MAASAMAASAMAASASQRAAGRREAGAVLVLALACCIFFWKAVTLRGVFFHYDHALQNYPYRQFFAEGLRQGHLPLWTGDIFCGFPLFAESQGNALYPPFLVLFGLFEPWVAYNYYTVLHFLLAGIFTYVLARVMRVGRAGAVLAGICYMLAGPLLFHAHHTNIVVGICWLPLLLALLELTVRRRTALPLLGFAGATAALILGAQPQYTLYCGLVCGLFLLFRLHLTELTGGRARTSAVILAWAGCAAMLALLLSAVQVLPLLELVGHTSRGAAGAAGLRSSSGVPGNLLTVFLPHYFGSPGLGSYWGNLEVGFYSELTLFVGVAPLFLAILGALTHRSRRALLFIGLGAFAFIFSLGSAGALSGVFAYLPVFGSSRFPQRFAFVTALCVAMLAGMGLEQLLCAAGRRRVRRAAVASVAVVLVLATLCLAVAAAGQAHLMRMGKEQLAAALPLGRFELEVVWRHLHQTLPADIWRLVAVAVAGTVTMLLCARRVLPAWIAAALWCGLIFGDLAWSGRDFNVVTGPSIYLEPPALARALNELEPGRIFRYRHYDEVAPERHANLYPFTRGWGLDTDRYASCLDTLPHNANLLWGIPSVNGFSPLQTLPLKTLLGRPDNLSTLIEFELSPALNLLGARYILSPRDQLPGNLTHLSKVAGINIFRNEDALPRAFIVHKALPSVDEQHTVVALRDEGFDHRSRLFIHDARQRPLAGEPGRADEDEFARITEDTHDSIAITARLNRPGYLVLADQYYPGWQVEVDGAAAELLRVDYLLKGVRLDAGEHRLRFSFRPRSFRLGCLASLCALVVLGVGIALTCRGRRLPGAGGPDSSDQMGRPYGRATAVLVVLTCVLFLALGVLLCASVWRRLPRQLGPRRYVVAEAMRRAAYLGIDDRPLAAYATLRDVTRWWPENPRLRYMLAARANEAVRDLLNAGRAEEAAAIAVEVMEMAPQEAREMAPVLMRLAARAERVP